MNCGRDLQVHVRVYIMYIANGGPFIHVYFEI